MLWSIGLDRPPAYFLVLFHNVFAEMYYCSLMCFAVFCVCGREINYVNYVNIPPKISSKHPSLNFENANK